MFFTLHLDGHCHQPLGRLSPLATTQLVWQRMQATRSALTRLMPYSRCKKPEEQTDWFRVVCFDKLAEIAGQYLKKGHRDFVEGRLQIREYTGRDGSKKTSAGVIAHDMIMLSGDGQKSKQPVASKGKSYNPTEWLDEVDEMGDVPF